MEIETIVGNRFTQFYPPFPKEELREAFSFFAPNYFFMPKYRAGLWDGRISKFKYGKVPTGLFLGLQQEVEKQYNVKFDTTFKTQFIAFQDIEPSDRQYQNDCEAAMRKAAGTGGGIVLAATGVGKTVIAGRLFRSLKGPGLFIVDELTLLEQNREAIAKVIGEPVGKVGESEFIPARITCATIQTLFLHYKQPEFRNWLKRNLVFIVDELHVMLNNRNFKFVESIRPPVVYGLTATLQLKDRAVLFNAYSLVGPVVYRFPLEEATKQGFLTRGLVVQLQVQTNIPEPKTYEEVSSYQELYTLLTQDKNRNKMVVELAKAAVKNQHKVVVLVERVAHVKLIAKMLKKELKLRMVYGAIPTEERRKAIKEFEDGKVDVIVANRVFSKGIDIRSVDFIIDTTAGKSANNAVQRYGRGVRLAEGKRSLVYVDITETDERFHPSSNARKRAFQKEGIRLFKVEAKPNLNLNRFVKTAVQVCELFKETKDNETETKQAGASHP